MFTNFVNYLTRDVRPFMDLLSFKGQLVDPMAYVVEPAAPLAEPVVPLAEPVALNDNAVNDNVVREADIAPPEAAA